MIGEEKLLLPVVGPIVPRFAGKVAAEEAPHHFGSWVPAVEEPAGGEVVELAIHVEFPVGDDFLIRMAA